MGFLVSDIFFDIFLHCLLMIYSGIHVIFGGELYRSTKMRFYCTLDTETYSPLEIFGVQGPPVPEIENKFVQLKNFLVGTSPSSLEEFRNDLAFNVSMMLVAVLMLLGIFTTGRRLAKNVYWLIRMTVGLFRFGSNLKKNIASNANYLGCEFQKERLVRLKEAENMVQDMNTAYEGISTQLSRLELVARNILKRRKSKVLVKSSVIVTSYPGSDELEDNFQHKDCLESESKLQLPFGKCGGVNSNEATASTNKERSNIPTEEDWLRYYEEELAEQEKLQVASQETLAENDSDSNNLHAKSAQVSDVESALPGFETASPRSLLESVQEMLEIRGAFNKLVADMELSIFGENLQPILDGVEKSCSSSTVFGTIRKRKTKMRRRIERKVHFMEAIKEEISEKTNMTRFASGDFLDNRKERTATEFDNFKLQLKVLNFTDDFQDGLSIITGQDVEDVCGRTPFLAPLTPNESTEVELWLRN